MRRSQADSTKRSHAAFGKLQHIPMYCCCGCWIISIFGLAPPCQTTDTSCDGSQPESIRVDEEPHLHQRLPGRLDLDHGRQLFGRLRECRLDSEQAGETD